MSGQIRQGNVNSEFQARVKSHLQSCAPQNPAEKKIEAEITPSRKRKSPSPTRVDQVKRRIRFYFSFGYSFSLHFHFFSSSFIFCSLGTQEKNQSYFTILFQGHQTATRNDLQRETGRTHPAQTQGFQPAR